MRESSINRIKVVACIVLLILAIISLGLGIRKSIHSSTDFQWDSVKVLSHRVDPYIASGDPTNEYYSMYEEYYDHLEANQFPSLLWLLIPYTVFGPETAKVAWMLSNLFFLTGLVIVLRKTIWKKMESIDFLLVSLALLASSPIRNQIFLGQHSIFAVFFVFLAIYFINTNEMLSGVMLAISYFKYSLTAPVMLFFLYKKKWKPIVVSGIVHIVLSVFSAIWLHRNIIDMMLAPVKQASWLTSSGFADAVAVLSMAGIRGSVGTIITVVVFLALAIWCLTTKNKNEYQILIILILWSLIFMYHRKYDYFVLIIPFAAAVSSKLGMSFKKKNIEYIWRALVITITGGLFIVDWFIDPLTVFGSKLMTILDTGLYEAVYNGFNLTMIIILYAVLILTYLGMNVENRIEVR